MARHTAKSHKIRKVEILVIQIPNLKKATIMSSNFDKVKEIFDAENIDVELL